MESQYCRSLNLEQKALHKAKLLHLGGLDPYNLSERDLSTSLNAVPRISNARILEFLLFKSSSATKGDLRTHKSLEVYVQFACKLVKGIGALKYEDQYLILGKVLHSQTLTDKPLRPWFVLTEGEIDILTSHCDCVVGFGELCTHVAALLFALEYAGTHASEEKSVTDVLAYWIQPRTTQVFHKALGEIDFTHPKKLLEGSSSSSDFEEAEEAAEAYSSESDPRELSPDERKQFLQRFKEKGQVATLFQCYKDLRVTPDNLGLPRALTELYDPVNSILPQSGLEMIAEAVCVSGQIEVTKEMAELIFK